MQSSSQRKNFQDQELPTNASVGELDPVAYFYDAMPAGVTVSGSGRVAFSSTTRSGAMT